MWRFTIFSDFKRQLEEKKTNLYRNDVERKNVSFSSEFILKWDEEKEKKRFHDDDDDDDFGLSNGFGHLFYFWRG